MRKNQIENATKMPSKPSFAVKKETVRLLSARQLTLAVGGGPLPTLTGHCY